MTDEHKEIQLPAGPIRYREAGEGKPIVFIHGYLVDHRLWDGVVDRLSDRFRCIAPDWPLAAHRAPMNPDADLSPPGIAKLVSDFLAKLELEDVTIVGNDSGGAMSQVLVTTHPERIGRLVLTNCDTHQNFPPGPFKAMPPLAKLPGGMFALSLPFRIPAVARAAFRPFTKTKLPKELIASWMEPAKSDSAILRDAAKVTAGMNKRYTLEAAEKLRGSQLPIRLLWATGDRVFPISYAERLAGEAGNASVVPIPDARTFVSLDQPARVAQEIAEFAASP
ncbi:MAG TPA: alpha/beta hydrolase [Solirubrobacterales bacterium]|nr:alpha/beta hydrolase [Solirubrobacterales bacterium]